MNRSTTTLVVSFVSVLLLAVAWRSYRPAPMVERKTHISAGERLRYQRLAAWRNLEEKREWNRFTRWRDALDPRPAPSAALAYVRGTVPPPPLAAAEDEGSPPPFTVPLADRGHAVNAEGPKADADLEPLPMPGRFIVVGGAPAHPTRLVAQLAGNPQAEELAAALEELNIQMIGEPTSGGMVVLDVGNPPPASGEADAGPALSGIKALQTSGLIAYAEPDFLLARTRTPVDEAFLDGRLWGLRNQGQSGGTAGVDIGAVEAWDKTTGSIDVIVAVIDTGIRHSHHDLSGQMWRNPGEIPDNGADDDNDGYVDNVFGIDVINDDGDPMDDNGHGTHCAGTIGAAADNGQPHVGVAWQVRLMACKFLSAEGWGYTSGAVASVDFAVENGAHILSNSWGGGGSSQSLQDALTRARDKGVLVICAAGNSGVDTDRNPHYPSGYDLDNIVAVAAVDRTGGLASWSNYGRQSVDLGAPGVSIFSTLADSDTAFGTYSGTSMATPHVAGVAALVLANEPTLGLAELKNRLVNTAKLLPSLEGKVVSGGMVNAPGALGGGGDDTLELALAVDRSPLRGGCESVFSARVTDVGPVLDASVFGTLTGAGEVTFLDNGEAPDTAKDDGVYTVAVMVPSDKSVDEVELAVTVSADGKESVTVTVSYPVVYPPVNDDFADCVALSGVSASLSGHSNVAATAEEGEPRHYWFRPQASVWFTWTAPFSGRVVLRTTGSDFDTVLAVYRGTSLNRLRRVARDDDSGGRLTSRVRFNVRQGRAYHIAIDGWGGAEGNLTGTLKLKKRKPFRPRQRAWWWRW